jgi:alpha-beta hydrolase superfamily lysophospholipase
LCGSDDPCTKNGQDSRSFEKKLLKAGLKDFTCQILNDTRHESLNEWNRDQTTEMFLIWLMKRF